LIFKTFPYGWHPYLECYSRSMNFYNISVIPGQDFNNKILYERELTGIHFHWIEYLCSASNSFMKFKSVLGLYSFLRLAKRLKKRILWTVHNHHPHDSASPLFYRMLAFLLARSSDLIIVHSNWSKNYVLKKFKPNCSVVVMYHGNFIGYFKSNFPVSALKKRYGLNEDLPVCSVIGTIRPYRGHELSIRILEYLTDVQLVIAGMPYSSQYLDFLKRVAKPLEKRVFFFPRRLTDDEYADFLKLTDIVLLPYHKVTTSGALLASWSMGRPVVCPWHPYFSELLGENSPAGHFARLDARDFSHSIFGLLSYPEKDRFMSSINKAKRYDWNIVVRPVVQALKSFGL